MLSPFEQALADVRGIQLKAPEPEETAAPEREEPRSSAGCCTGDRRGYAWHQRTGNLPACEDSLAANRAYMVPYTREWKRRRSGAEGGGAR